MTRTLFPGGRTGAVVPPASKSHVHRLLICAALSRTETDLLCGELSDDLQATADCLCAMGAGIVPRPGGLHIVPIPPILPERVTLPCRESGSTLRFLLPVVGALGLCGEFRMQGRLSQRPMEPLEQALCGGGMCIRHSAERIAFSGQLLPGEFEIPGNISSQFISGLLLALPLLPGSSTLRITGTLESGGYVALTEAVLQSSGIRFQKQTNGYSIPGGQVYALPADAAVQPDWSGAAAFACRGALSERGIRLAGLHTGTMQADEAVVGFLRRFGAVVTEDAGGICVRKGSLHGIDADVSQCPDLAPVLCALGALAPGQTRLMGAERLRFKETDRLESIRGMLLSLGARIEAAPDGLCILSDGALPGGCTRSFGDHRIAMAAAVAACGCKGGCTLQDAQAVGKSYPAFWRDYDALEAERI